MLNNMFTRSSHDVNVNRSRKRKRSDMAEESISLGVSLDGDLVRRDTLVRNLIDERWKGLRDSLPSLETRTEWTLCRQEMVTLVFVYNAIRIGISPMRVPPVNSSIALKDILADNADRYVRYADDDRDYQKAIKDGLDLLGGVPKRKRKFGNQLFCELPMKEQEKLLKQEQERERQGPNYKLRLYSPPNCELTTKVDDYRYVKRVASRLAIVITSLEQVGWEMSESYYTWGVLRDLLYLPPNSTIEAYERIVLDLMTWWNNWFSRQTNERPGSATLNFYERGETVPLCRVAKFAEAWYRISTFVNWRNRSGVGASSVIRCARKLALGQPWPQKLAAQVREQWVRDYVFDTARATRTDVTESGSDEVLAAIEGVELILVPRGKPAPRFRPSTSQKVNKVLGGLMDEEEWTEAELVELAQCLESRTRRLTSDAPYAVPVLPSVTVVEDFAPLVLGDESHSVMPGGIRGQSGGDVME